LLPLTYRPCYIGSVAWSLCLCPFVTTMSPANTAEPSVWSGLGPSGVVSGTTVRALVLGRFTHTHTHTRLTALCPGLPRWASTRKVKPIWILRKQETVSGSEICRAICKSAPCSRQITTPAPHRSVFYRPDALPAAQPIASKH